MFRQLLSRRGLSFDRLAVILDLAAAGGLAKAANGDASRQIKKLEDCFGVGLTHRRGHKLELTDAGRRLVAIGRGTFAQLEDFHSECEAGPSEVLIGAGDSVLQWLQLPRLGCYGDKAAITPNLDRLASESVRLNRAYAPGFVCIPSRTSFMLGLNYRHAGANHFKRHPETLPRGVYLASKKTHLSFTQGSSHGDSHPHLANEFAMALVEGRDRSPMRCNRPTGPALASAPMSRPRTNRPTRCSSRGLSVETGSCPRSVNRSL